jgi:hypothetical protein
MANLDEEKTIEDLNDCKEDMRLRLIRATLLCESSILQPQCKKENGSLCPFKIKGRLFRGNTYTCAVSLMNLILEKEE